MSMLNIEEYHEYCHNFWLAQDLLKYERLKDKMGKISLADKSHYFLTINPDTTKVSLAVFLKAIHKAMSKKWITEYEWVIEQRGECEAEVGKGYHTHIIFNKGIKHSKVVLEMTNSFKHIVDMEHEMILKWFNLKSIDAEEKVRKTGYILDRKADPAKWLKQDMDIIFRQNHGLQKSYKSAVMAL